MEDPTATPSSSSMPPSSDPAHDNNDRVVQLDRTIAKLENELRTFRDTMHSTPPHKVMVHRKLKQQALQTLTRKRQYERLREQTIQQQFQLEQLHFQLESATATASTVQALHQARTTLQQTVPRVEAVDAIQLDLQEAMEELGHVDAAMTAGMYATPFDDDDDIDDAALEAEFLLLEDELNHNSASLSSLQTELPELMATNTHDTATGTKIQPVTVKQQQQPTGTTSRGGGMGAFGNALGPVVPGDAATIGTSVTTAPKQNTVVATSRGPHLGQSTLQSRDDDTDGPRMVRASGSRSDSTTSSSIGLPPKQQPPPSRGVTRQNAMVVRNDTETTSSSSTSGLASLRSAHEALGATLRDTNVFQPPRRSCSREDSSSTEGYDNRTHTRETDDRSMGDDDAAWTARGGGATVVSGVGSICRPPTDDATSTVASTATAKTQWLQRQQQQNDDASTAIPLPAFNPSYTCREDSEEILAQLSGSSQQMLDWQEEAVAAKSRADDTTVDSVREVGSYKEINPDDQLCTSRYQTETAFGSVLGPVPEASTTTDQLEEEDPLADQQHSASSRGLMSEADILSVRRGLPLRKISETDECSIPEGSVTPSKNPEYREDDADDEPVPCSAPDTTAFQSSSSSLYASPTPEISIRKHVPDDASLITMEDTTWEIETMASESTRSQRFLARQTDDGSVGIAQVTRNNNNNNSSSSQQQEQPSFVPVTGQSVAGRSQQQRPVRIPLNDQDTEQNTPFSYSQGVGRQTTRRATTRSEETHEYHTRTTERTEGGDLQPVRGPTHSIEYAEEHPTNTAQRSVPLMTDTDSYSDVPRGMLSSANDTESVSEEQDVVSQRSVVAGKTDNYSEHGLVVHSQEEESQSVTYSVTAEGERTDLESLGAAITRDTEPILDVIDEPTDVIANNDSAEHSGVGEGLSCRATGDDNHPADEDFAVLSQESSHRAEMASCVSSVQPHTQDTEDGAHQPSPASFGGDPRSIPMPVEVDDNLSVPTNTSHSIVDDSSVPAHASRGIDLPTEDSVPVSALCSLQCPKCQQLLPIPRELCCSITGELMADPVIAADGWTYERASIQQYFDAQTEEPIVSPSTHVELPSRLLLPNKNILALCQSYTEC